MHGLLEKLGRKIVQEKSSEESRKWSRVWLHEQFCNVIYENMEKNVGAVMLEKKMLTVETLSKMSHLRLLILKGVTFSGNLSCLSNELRYVEWDRYPFMCLPPNFQPNQLVELILRHSNIKQLWNDKKFLPNLRVLDMSHSKKLRTMPDIGEIPNLERLNFEGCLELVLMDPSIGILRKLVFLNLKDCKKLVTIPDNIFCLKSLEYLNLSGCPKVFENPRHLNVSEIASHFQSTMSAIFKWTTSRFHLLYPSAHKDLASCLLPSLLSLSCLREVDISFCSIHQLPDTIGCLHWLERLDLGGNNFVTLPSLRELSKLVYLNLEHCELLESLPQFPFLTAIDDMTVCLRKTGLIIFNCPKLGERERCNSRAFSWMAQLIQAIGQSSTAYFQETIHIVIPQSELPIWLNTQSEGDSIRINISPIMHDDNENNLICIACCAVFSIAPVDPTRITYEDRKEVSLRFSYGTTSYIWYTKIPVILKKDLITVKSDHMCIIYFPFVAFLDIMKSIGENPEQYYDFIINMNFDMVSTHGMDLEVRNCGYRWVYKQDLQLMHHCTNSFAKIRHNHSRSCNYLKP